MSSEAQRTTSAPAGTGRMPALDGLRGIAILLVVAAHSGVDPTRYFGPPGVTIFFVLSGFLITGLLLQQHRATGRIDLATFYLDRAVRLVPALLVLVAGVAVLWAISGRALVDYVPWAVPTLLYVANFYLDITVPNVFAHTWSLAVEEQFYLIWPLVLLVLLAWRRSWALALVLATIAVSIGLRLAMVDHTAHAYASLPTNVFALLLGAAVAMVGTGWVTPLLRSVLLVVAPLGIGYLVLTYGESWPKNINGTPMIALLATAWVAAAAGGSRVLGSAPLRYVGRVSYAWYLWHWPLIFFVEGAVVPSRGVPAAAVAFVVAVLSTHLVEEPLRRRWRSRRRAVATLAPAAAVV